MQPSTSVNTAYPDADRSATGAFLPAAYFTLARAVRASSLSTHHRAILTLSLALRADEEGVAWPEAVTIAGDTGMSRRGVQYALLELEALGVIARVDRSVRSTAWVIVIGRIHEVTPAEIAEARRAVKAHRVRSTSTGPSAPSATESAPGARMSAPGAPDLPKITPDHPTICPSRGASGTTEGGEEAVEEAPKAERSPDPKATAIAAVWAAYRVHHPRCGATPPGAEHRMIGARLTERKRVAGSWDAAVEELVAVIDCHHVSPTCAWFQGQNPEGRPYLGVETLLKPTGMTTRIETARRWVAQGKPVAPKRVPGADQAAEAAWSYLGRLIREGARGVPDDLAAKVGMAKASALHAGLSAVGGWTAFGRLRGHEERDAKAAFVAAFVADFADGGEA